MRFPCNHWPTPVFSSACINAPSVLGAGSPMRGVPSQSPSGNGGEGSGCGKSRPLLFVSGGTVVFGVESDGEEVWANMETGALPIRAPAASAVPIRRKRVIYMVKDAFDH